MKNQKLVSIIIISWNGLHWLKKSLPSIYKNTYTSFEVILVDNSSSDSTESWVRSNYPDVRILSQKNNLGYAEANNNGFAVSRGEYVLFLNNDVTVAPTFITELVNSIETDDTVAGAQSKILLMDEPDRYDTIGAFLTSTGFLYHYCFMNKADKKYDHQINIFTPKGACMLFTRNSLEKVLIDGKLFDPEAFAYFEETDVAQRIWMSGKRIIYAPNSIIFHKMGGTSTSMNNAFIQFHSFKNRLACYLKNLEIVSLIQILPIHILCCEIFALLYLTRMKFSVALSIQKAILWNILHISQTLRKRAIVQQKIRNIPDSKYFPMILKNPPLQFYLSQAKGSPYVDNQIV